MGNIFWFNHIKKYSRVEYFFFILMKHQKEADIPINSCKSGEGELWELDSLVDKHGKHYLANVLLILGSTWAGSFIVWDNWYDYFVGAYLMTFLLPIGALNAYSLIKCTHKKDVIDSFISENQSKIQSFLEKNRESIIPLSNRVKALLEKKGIIRG